MFSTLRFRHPWRAYQERILRKLDDYRDDGKVHVVAPPGAGKTVLGLEIVRRYGRKTLVLAPSLTIRNQWAERLRLDFATDAAAVADWISHDLGRSAPLTIVTYQAFHQARKREAAAPDLSWVEVLVVDECHHLRREWWRSLSGFCTEVAPELVALTATPPFDVSGLEWRRYRDFCGEIDEQISIPELVAAGDLCPHQDYVYPVLPDPELLEQSRAFAEQRVALYVRLKESIFLARYLRAHPWLQAPEAHYAEIFAAPEYFSALLVVLGYLGSEPPAAALGVLHGELTVPPALDDGWLAVFLRRALREDSYFAAGEPAEQLRPLRRQLTEMGAWDRGRLHLSEPPRLGKKMRTGAAKLRAVGEIASLEWSTLGEKLRMVILTDYIYPELLPTTEHDRAALAKIGVSTLFEQLRRLGRETSAANGFIYTAVAAERLAVITGSLVIIPEAARERLLAIAYAELPAARGLRLEPLFPGSAYLRVMGSGDLTKHLVAWLTELLTEGTVNILIGTTALLGEGWDAPAINSLVLAGTVGSFVLSNQMRGRAIRTYAAQPAKTANIWHPVVVNPALPDGGTDVRSLRRRFRNFAGPTASGYPLLTNGLRRYPIDLKGADAQAIEKFRALTRDAARMRDAMAERWWAALAHGDHLIEAIEPPNERYFAREDRLSRYYFEESDRRQREEVRKFDGRWRSALLISFLLTPMCYFLDPEPVWGVYLFLAVAITFGQGLIWSLARLRRDRRRLGLPRSERELPGYKYVLYSLGASLVFLVFDFSGPSLFLALLITLLYFLLPNMGSTDAVRRYELLTDGRERLQRYGRALVSGLIAADKIEAGAMEQLIVEEDEKGRQLAYLTQADHHDTHLFAECMSELMNPPDNPRFLLKLRRPPEWREGDYYLPVPYALAKNKQLSEPLQAALARELEQAFDLVYTRDPAGRLHLLAAKLQFADRAEERAAKREMIWR